MRAVTERECRDKTHLGRARCGRDSGGSGGIGRGDVTGDRISQDAPAPAARPSIQGPATVSEENQDLAQPEGTRGARQSENPGEVGRQRACQALYHTSKSRCER